MTTALKTRTQKGFTLLESMVALVMFLLVCGAVFKLLGDSQRRYQTESQVTNSFQDAQLALDQIVRDADDAGYPPFSNFSNLPGACGGLNECASFVNSPIAWNPGYPALAPCTIGGTCVTPGNFDVIFEEEADNSANVQWIRYTLQGTTLYRGSAIKATNGDPAATVSIAAGNMLPYITGVMNNATAAQIAQFQASYPAMFPGNAPQPVFQFYCANRAARAAPVLCQANPGLNAPANVVDVEITLILQTPQRDAQTGALQLVELNGRGHVINPNQ